MSSSGYKNPMTSSPGASSSRRQANTTETGPRNYTWVQITGPVGTGAPEISAHPAEPADVGQPILNNHPVHQHASLAGQAGASPAAGPAAPRPLRHARGQIIPPRMGNDGRFGCPVPGCSSTLKNRRNYTTHIRSVHGPPKSPAAPSNLPQAMTTAVATPHSLPRYNGRPQRPAVIPVLSAADVARLSFEDPNNLDPFFRS